MAETLNLSRRMFLATGAAGGAGLVLGVSLPDRLDGDASRSNGFEPNAFIQIGTDGSVIIWCARPEMGQGVRTSMPMIVAEELDVPWEGIEIRQAPAHATKYGRMSVGGSGSVRGSWDPLRRAGAAGRMMLRQAAAATWNVPVEECETEPGEVVHRPSGRRAHYASLATSAADLPVPDNPPLKDPSTYRILGRPIPRTDTPLKVNGTARFGIDIKQPGMKIAMVSRCPVFGGRAATWDAGAALGVQGVRGVYQIERGVAVVADDTWSAIKGRRALTVEWDEGDTRTLTSGEISERLRRAAEAGGAVAQDTGSFETAQRAAARTVRATYEVPFLSHAPMEPQNTLAWVREDRCEIWTPCQVPQSALRRVARMTGLPDDRITINITFLGGGFGRRLETDYVAEAVELSRLTGGPVKVVWEREDDIRQDWYRPASVHVLEAAVDETNQPVAWRHCLAAPSIAEYHSPGIVSRRHGMDRGAVAGARDLAYGFPNIRVEYAWVPLPIPVGWWRSVFDSQNAFANECFVDELAEIAGSDPVAFRRAWLRDRPRHLGVLNLAAERAGWGTPLPAGHAHGVAVHKSFGTSVAHVADVSIDNGRPRVHRVVAAVDCGFALNPETVEAQIQGAIVYGLTAALKGRITIRDGRVVESNFHDYRMLRIHEMPDVEVHIVRSGERPTGIGEPGLPPIAPAVANALYRLTGTRIRTLPITL